MHGRDAHKSTCTEQLGPVKPTEQLQAYELTRSTHTARLLQGFDAHSLIFVSHVLPVYPGIQLHVKLERKRDTL